MPIISQRTGEDERSKLFPPELLPLFDDAFIVSCDDASRYKIFQCRHQSYLLILRNAVGEAAVASSLTLIT